MKMTRKQEEVSRANAQCEPITINAERKKHGLDPIPDGDIELISIFDSQ